MYSILVYIDSKKLMIGKFLSENNIDLLYSINLGKNETDQLSKLNFTN